MRAQIGPTKATARAAGQLRVQRARSHARPHDPGRSVRPVRLPRRPGARPDLHLEVRRAERGVLTPNDPPAGWRLPPGDGPRHFHFPPERPLALLDPGRGLDASCCSTTIGASGRLTARQTISTLPPGFAGSNFCSEILVSADGRFVYAGNRLHDSIGIFADRPGRHADIRRRGVDPRELPAELRLRSDRAVSLLLQPARQTTSPCSASNRKTGGLAFTGQYVPVGNPSHVVFLDLK